MYKNMDDFSEGLIRADEEASQVVGGACFIGHFIRSSHFFCHT